jgi:hypothetical protein
LSTFDNIGGIYAKDAELRQSVNDLRSAVTSKTIKPLTVTNDGTYTANPAEGVYGYSPVTVSVNPPWEPLEDGYSNFWFELTDDTLSPWLNFSAKNNDAVIDWGDGSGEVALDTLTPTHTYSKAGRYVVKVKGVTGIAQQISLPNDSAYTAVLTSVELNNDVTTIENYSFRFCGALKNVIISNSVISGGGYAFQFDTLLSNLTIGNGNSLIGAYFLYYNYSLGKITIPSVVEEIGNNAFAYCRSVTEIHVKAISPPTLGTNVFQGLSADWLCYVPTGTAETYKAASGWSTYADHIVEEGQSLSKAQLRAIEEEQKKSDNEEMR